MYVSVPCTCVVPTEAGRGGHLVFLTKSQLFGVTIEDLGARCWGESLLAQRGTESTQLTFLSEQ